MACTPARAKPRLKKTELRLNIDGEHVNLPPRHALIATTSRGSNAYNQTGSEPALARRPDLRITSVRAGQPLRLSFAIAKSAPLKFTQVGGFSHHAFGRSLESSGEFSPNDRTDHGSAYEMSPVQSARHNTLQDCNNPSSELGPAGRDPHSICAIDLEAFVRLENFLVRPRS